MQLKNGDRITGKIISENTNEVVVTTTWLKDVTVPISQIEKREKIPVPAVPLAATNSVAQTGTNVVARSGTNAVTKTVGPPIQPKPPKRWNFDAQLGVNLQFNQKSSELYYSTIKANYIGLRYRDIFDYKANYGRTDGTNVTADNMNGSARTEYDLTPNKRAFLFNAVGAGYDEIRKIDFTYDESVGVGYKFIDQTNFVFSADSGLNYQEEFFHQQITTSTATNGTRKVIITNPPSKDYMSLRFGETAVWKINSRMNWDEKMEFYPRLTSWSDYRLRVESNLSYKINLDGHLYLNLTFIDAYDTKPAANVTQNDLQIRSTLGVKF